jgi:hypothetical protein
VAWLTSLRLSLRHFLKQFVIEVVVVGDGAGLEQEHFDRRQRFGSIARLAVAGSLRSDDVVRPRGGGSRARLGSASAERTTFQDPPLRGRPQGADQRPRWGSPRGISREALPACCLAGVRCARLDLLHRR